MGIFMYSDFAIGDASKKYLMSLLIDIAPSLVSDIVRLTRILICTQFLCH